MKRAEDRREPETKHRAPTGILVMDLGHGAGCFYCFQVMRAINNVNPDPNRFHDGKSTNCPACTRWRKKIANRRKEDGKNMSGLKDTLTQFASSAAVAEVLKGLDRAVVDAQKALDNAQKALDEAVSVRDAVKRALVPAPRELAYLSSRTGDSVGHFIERFPDGRTTCSCPAARYNHSCWAQKVISYLRNRGDQSYGYPATDFDAKRAPTFPSSYKPSLSTLRAAGVN